MKPRTLLTTGVELYLTALALFALAAEQTGIVIVVVERDE